MNEIPSPFQPVNDLLSVGHPIAALRIFLAIVDAHLASRAHDDVIDAATRAMIETTAQAIHKMLATTAASGLDTAWRALPDLPRRLESLLACGPEVAQVAFRIKALLESRQEIDPSAPGNAPHIFALLELVGYGVGLPAQLSWYGRSGAHDDAITQLDEAGEQQVGTAAKVLLGLADKADVDAIRAFNENRQLLPLLRVDLVARISGASLGLPAFLAMLAARYNLRPALGTAATGELDLKKLPTSPGTGRYDDSVFQAFLDLPILSVGGIAAKIRAALEDAPVIRRVLVPADNRPNIEGDPALTDQIASTKLDIIYVHCIGDVFGEKGIFTEPLYAAPLRQDPYFTDAQAPAATRWALALAALCALGIAQVLYYFLHLVPEAA